MKEDIQLPAIESWQEVAKLERARIRMFRFAENKPQLLFPPHNGDRGLWSTDAPVLRACADLGDELTRLEPATIDDDGFAGPNAVTSDFYKLRNVSGMLATPMTVPPVDNSYLVDELKLATGFLNERHRRIFDALHAYMFSTIREAPLSIRKEASSGFPFFQNTADFKKSELFLFNNEAAKILPRFHAGDLRGLFHDYGLFCASYIGVRLQPDSIKKENGKFVPKAREANDELFARSGGREGSRRPSDKAVYRKGEATPLDGFFAMRRRTVYGYPSAYNYWLTQFFTLFRAFYLDDGAFTWKHRGSNHIYEKLANYQFIIGADVKQFDQSVQDWILQAWCDGLNRVLKPDVVEFLRAVLHQPYFQPHPNVGGGYPFNPCFGDPFDLSTFTNRIGLPSGIGPNPDLGKFVMTWAYLCLFDDYFKDVLEVGVQTIIQGRHPRYALLDMGDDAVIATNDGGFNDWLRKRLASDEPFYVRVEPEQGVAFLGNILYKDHGGRFAVAPNPVTFVVNWLVPEKGIQSPSRRDFFATGWQQRMQDYSSTPAFDRVLSTWEDVWRKHFGEGLNGRFVAAAREERSRNVPALSVKDQMVLEDPSRLHYKIDPSEVSEWVLDRVVASVAFEDYFPSIEKWFK